MLPLLKWIIVGNGLYPRYYLLWMSCMSVLINRVEMPIARQTYKAGITNVKPIEDVEVEDMFDPEDLK